MSKEKKVVLGVIILAVLLMAIGYANLGPGYLNITGTATASADQENFKVYFTGNATKDPANEANITTTVAAKSNTATVAFSGLTKKDDTTYVILEIENGSNDIDAASVEVTTSGNDLTGVINIEAIMCDANGGDIEDFSVACNEKTYVKVSATLLSTPTKTETTSIDVQIKATPVGMVTGE